MIDYTWVVNKLNVQEDGLVVEVIWRATGFDKENNFSSSYSGSTLLTREEVFVPYKQLTESQILNWCFEKTIDDVKTVKTDVEEQIAEQISFLLDRKTEAPALPWAVVA